ncbi:hypothetical protein B0T10DRAFT_600649 [Thelonectria olida]|uniref:C2H2-type domain-containing protein n=1 Tax=Thelonectria olida TaxID=1576542 RepID=A0A9P8WI55_9HYPO|nr:hypothetical protein B0T10DRAFT_600649 [Thelonectria olida]
MPDSMESHPANWELDSDEIASVASEDLYKNRPNRWTGPKSSWRTLTEEDRMLWHSMRQLKDQDLALHLYNAFGLKRWGRDATMAQDLMIRMGNGQDTAWVPPKLWTAWPLKPEQVPKNHLINSQHDDDDRFTFRKQEQTLPSTELEEEISATILRTAKRRFNRRKMKFPRRSIEATVEQSNTDDDVPGSSSRETSIKPETGDEDEEMRDTDLPKPIAGRSSASKTYETAVSANDDLSYDLLRPSVRHILSQLDNTLSILHNSRVAGLSYPSDSSTEEESDSQSGRKRPQGRPRKSLQVDASSSGADVPKTPTRRGRPRKVHSPRKGESHDDMLHRIAREAHRKLPTTPKDKDAAFEQWMQRSDEVIERERSLSLARSRDASRGVDTGSEASGGGNDQDRKLSRWGLRGWSDVLGAAALAGFPSDVIARATKRCADLFGEGMVVRKLNEAPVSNGAAIETVEYRPQPIRLSSCESDADGESDGEADLVQRRVASRQVSHVRSSHDCSSPESIRGRLSRTQSPAPAKSPRSRSRSRSSTAGMVFCPVSSCDRAGQGFTRKANLQRHIKLVHQGQAEEMDSDDEVVGAVHVDGFLRPIVPGRGWRGEDAITRKRKRYYGQSSKKGSRAPSSEGET